LNILIVTPHFHPENFRINDLADEFKNRGHNITVLTAIPDYPIGKFYDGYGLFKRNKENLNGLKIYRAPIIPRGSGSNTRLAINYISHVIGAIFTSFFILNKKFDIIFVFEPSPITIGLPAVFIKKIKKVPICFWVLDLWPESVVSAGNIKTNLIPKLLTPVVKFIYKNCDKILVSSNGFISSINDKGIALDKIEFFPQWAEKLFRPVSQKKNLLKINMPKNKFIIMFAGNIGEAQDFPSILKAAKLLKNKKKIQWVIIGSGRRSKWVKNKIKEYDLDHCFHMIGRHPIDLMPDFYALSDAMLFSLKDEDIFSITIPAKLQSYLACGKPILGMINGEAAKIINENSAGIACEAGDYNSLANNIDNLSNLKKTEISELSQNSLNCYKEKFERTYLLNKLENIFKSMTKKSEQRII
tara:strand:+ start:4010 stop:5251 length:1242 start_codon:yes stop_codon:yes gene_type:complete